MGIKAGLLVANSNGGLATAALAQQKPVFFISSGRSAGVVGAGRLGRTVNAPNLIVFDMGGTTASASLIQDGELARTSEYEFRAGVSTPSRFIKAGGYLMRVPTIDVAEVGSGAGSIAWLDAGGLLHVGPVSAGADPGPVCYGIGGDRPTVTDANVVLGLLPTELAGGSMRLDVEAARRAIARDIAEPLGLGVEAAALGIREIVNINMARAVRAVTVERGVDPRDFHLLAFGGSGPLHACEVARSLGIRQVIFPRAPGVFTAMGMLAGNIEQYFVRAHPARLDALDRQQLASVMRALGDEAVRVLAGEGYGADRIALAFELDLRFQGQDSELQVPLPPDPADIDPEALRTAFLNTYQSMYGYVSSDAVEVVNVHLRATGRGRSLDFAALDRERASGAAGEGRRRVYFDRAAGWCEVPVRRRSDASGSFDGPVILESADSTIVIPAGCRAGVDAAGNVVAVLA
jgi:N-methylhydantoinase A